MEGVKAAPRWNGGTHTVVGAGGSIDTREHGQGPAAETLPSVAPVRYTYVSC